MKFRSTRGLYQGLFRDRRITKHYEAVAPWRDDVLFPREHRSRLEESPQFFRMHEVPGEPNAWTHMELREVAGAWARAVTDHASEVSATKPQVTRSQQSSL